MLKWSITPALSAELKDAVADGTPPPGGRFTIENAAAQAPLITSTEYVPYNPQLTYEASGMFRQSDTVGSAGGVTLQVRFYDADKAFLEAHLVVDKASPGTSWTRYAGVFGAETPVTGPAGAQYVNVGAILNIDVGDVPGNQFFEVTGLSLTRGEPPRAAPSAGAVVVYGSTTSTTPATLDTFTVTTAGAGQVVLTYTGGLLFNCDASTTSARMCTGNFGICDSADTFTGCSPVRSIWYEDADNTTTSNAILELMLKRVVSVDAGTRTFYINASTAETSAPLGIWNGYVTVEFFPGSSLTVAGGTPAASAGQSPTQ